MTSRQKAAIARRLAIVHANLRAGLAPDEIKGEPLDAKAAARPLPAATAGLRCQRCGVAEDVILDGICGNCADDLRDETAAEFGARSVDPDPRLSSIIPPRRPVEVISEAGDITEDQWAYLKGRSAAMDTAAAARPQYHGIQGLPGGNNGGPNGSAGR